MSSKDSFVRDAVELRLVFALLLLMAVLIVQGCTAFNPQGAAIQQTPNYYDGERTASFRPSRKCSSRITWPTRATRRGELPPTSRQAPASSSQGTGFLLWGIHSIQK